MKFRPMQKFAACGLLLLALYPAHAQDAANAAVKTNAVVPLDRIVAVVNDEVITRHELDDQLQTVVKQLNKQGTPLPPEDVLERQLLDRMINDRVQLQFAKETGMRVDDTQLEKTIGRIAEENRLTPQQFRDTLEKDGMDFNKFRDEIRSEILMVRLKEREVDSKVQVSDAEIDSYLKAQAADSNRSEEYNLAHILVRVPEQATPEQIAPRRARAEAALAQLNNGADFGQVSAGYSDAPDALQGGVMGWRPTGRLPAIFSDALKAMKPGDISPILKSANGFHILKLLDKRGEEGPAVVTQTHARHILVKTSEITSSSDAAGRLKILKERIDNGADFGELARQHSEDASASRGGDLGWISPGDTVPEFERAMDALKPGQVSDPVQSPFGWHLIQVVERRNEDMTKERQRLAARQAIRARKADEAYQEWLRQLRDRAYVEYRLDDKP